jgi:hypothetical protein
MTLMRLSPVMRLNKRKVHLVCHLPSPIRNSVPSPASVFRFLPGHLKTRGGLQPLLSRRLLSAFQVARNGFRNGEEWSFFIPLALRKQEEGKEPPRVPPFKYALMKLSRYALFVASSIPYWILSSIAEFLFHVESEDVTKSSPEPPFLLRF